MPAGKPMLIGSDNVPCRGQRGGSGDISLVECLNPAARRSRVNWLTELGVVCQGELVKSKGLTEVKHDFPRVDWEAYGWICFSHRSAVVKALTRPMQPATIKRVGRFRDPQIRMSANNVRDIIRLFLERGIVQKVSIRGKAHPRYELTEMGRKMQDLLFSAERRT